MDRLLISPECRADDVSLDCLPSPDLYLSIPALAPWAPPFIPHFTRPTSHWPMLYVSGLASPQLDLWPPHLVCPSVHPANASRIPFLRQVSDHRHNAEVVDLLQTYLSLGGLLKFRQTGHYWLNWDSELVVNELSSLGSRLPSYHYKPRQPCLSCSAERCLIVSTGPPVQESDGSISFPITCLGCIVSQTQCLFDVGSTKGISIRAIFPLHDGAESNESTSDIAHMVTWSPQKPHTPPSDSAPPPATQDSELGSGRRRDCTTSPPRKRTRVSDEPENRALNESAAAAVESLQSILTVTGNEEPALLGRRLALALRPQQASFHIRIPLDALGNADAPHILDDLPSPSHTLLSFRTVIHVCPDGVLDVSGFGSHLTNSEVLKTFPDGLAPIQNLSSKTYDISQRRRVTRHSVTPRPAVSLPAIISNDTRHEGISTSNELDDPGFGDILTHQSALALLRTGVKDHTIAATWSFVRPILVGDALFHLRPTLQIHPDGILPLPDPDNIQRRHAQAMARSIPSLSLLPIPCPKIDVLSIASRPHDIYTSDTVAAILSGLALCFMATHPNQSISCGLSMKPISVIDAGVEIRQDWETSVVFLMNRPCGEEVNQQIRVESLDRLFGVILLDGSWVAVSLVKDDEDVVIFTQKPSQPHPDHSTASVVDMLRDGALGELVKRFFPSVSPRYRFKPQFSTMTPATSGPVALQIIRLLLQQGAIGSMALTFGGHSEHELEKRWRLRQAEWAVQRLEAEQQLRGVLQLLARNPRTDT